MSFESCESWWTPQSLPGQSFCHVPAAVLCWAVGLYSLSKVPFYLFAQTPPHGLEVCALLGFTTGFRGPKLFADPVLFLAPHDLMTAVIVFTLAVFLTGSFVLPSSRVQLGWCFFPLTMMFALHALPVRESIPSQLVQKPLVSILFIVTILCGAGIGFVGMLSKDDDGIVLGFYVCALTVLSATILDLAMAARAVFTFFTSSAWPLPPPVMIKDTDGVNTIWVPPTETQWEQQVANPHPRAGTCFYANLRRKIWVRVDADGFPVVISALTLLLHFHPDLPVPWTRLDVVFFVRPLQHRMLADGENIVVEEVVVNSATAVPPAPSVLQFGGATGFMPAPE